MIFPSVCSGTPVALEIDKMIEISSSGIQIIT